MVAIGTIIDIVGAFYQRTGPSLTCGEVKQEDPVAEIIYTPCSCQQELECTGQRMDQDTGRMVSICQCGKESREKFLCEGPKQNPATSENYRDCYKENQPDDKYRITFQVASLPQAGEPSEGPAPGSEPAKTPLLPKSPEEIEHAIEVFKDAGASEEEKLKALDMIGELVDPRILLLLLGVLKTSAPTRLRMGILQRLARHPASDEIKTALVELADGDKDIQVREMARRILEVKYGEIKFKLEKIGDRGADPSQRLTAIEYFRDYPDARALPMLLEVIERDEKPEIRRAAREAAAAHKTGLWIRISILVDPKAPTEERIKAAGELGALKDPRALPALLEILRLPPSSPARPKRLLVAVVSAVGEYPPTEEIKNRLDNIVWRGNYGADLELRARAVLTEKYGSAGSSLARKPSSYGRNFYNLLTMEFNGGLSLSRGIRLDSPTKTALLARSMEPSGGFMCYLFSTVGAGINFMETRNFPPYLMGGGNYELNLALKVPPVGLDRNYRWYLRLQGGMTAYRDYELSRVSTGIDQRVKLGKIRESNPYWGLQFSHLSQQGDHIVSLKLSQRFPRYETEFLPGVRGLTLRQEEPNISWLFQFAYEVNPFGVF